MRRFRATLEYDGTEYYGFQRQAKHRTVQAEVEAAIGRVCNVDRVVVSCAGRTDSGVHARGQVIAFNAEWRHCLSDLLRAINAHLPSDASVVALDYAEDGFDPRRAARWRRYEYNIYNAPVRSPLHARMSWRVWPELDLDAMQVGSDFLIGEHDFASFGRAPEKGGHTIRTVREAKWRAEGLFLNFTVEANAYLYHMVRSIVGALRLVGTGRWNADMMNEVLKSKDPGRCVVLAPPEGLVLAEVKY